MIIIKKNKHKAFGYSLFKKYSFYVTKGKQDHYRGKDCIERFCKDSKEHVTKIVNYKKKK